MTRAPEKRRRDSEIQRDTCAAPAELPTQEAPRILPTGRCHVALQRTLRSSLLSELQCITINVRIISTRFEQATHLSESLSFISSHLPKPSAGGTYSRLSAPISLFPKAPHRRTPRAPRHVGAPSLLRLACTSDGLHYFSLRMTGDFLSYINTA
jgi:hypothetical protein